MVRLFSSLGVSAWTRLTTYRRRTGQNSCSLHLHSVTQPHNYGRVFSSTAPGLVMGVGTIGPRLLPYDECDTFLSTDAGLTWRMVDDGAKKYEFGDQGSLLLMVEDEEPTDEIKYSFDYGKTWCVVAFVTTSLVAGMSPTFADLRTPFTPNTGTNSTSESRCGLDSSRPSPTRPRSSLSCSGHSRASPRTRAQRENATSSSTWTLRVSRSASVTRTTSKSGTPGRSADNQTA